VPAPERIAIVSTSYPTSADDPSGHFVATEARDLARAGHAVTVFTGGVARTTQDAAANPRVVRVWDGGATGWPGLVPRLKEQPTRGLGLVAWGLGIRRQLTRHGPFERVIGHFLLPTGFPLLLGANLAGAELTLVAHGSDVRLLGQLPAALSRTLVLGLCVKARVRCVSRELASLLQQIAGEPLEGRLSVAPAPIDVSTAPTRSEARAWLGVSDETRLIVVVSRLISSKRIDDALAAAALLPAAVVIVVGDGPELSRLRSTYPEARFVGRVARGHALTWISAADALLSASRLEGAPSAVREARALGVPVVASAAGDLAEWAERDPELWVVDL
jgi:teichuronic acid biosynthesis glycosyltransferase TuaC